MAGRIILGTANPSLNGNGSPVVGSTLTFYLNHTTTLQSVYTAVDLMTPLANPLTCYAGGAFPQIWGPDAIPFSVKWSRPGMADVTFDDVYPSALPTSDHYRLVDVVATANADLATGLANGQTIDGQVLATGMRVLLTAQSTPAENGIYDAPVSGTATRSSDATSASAMPNGIMIVPQRGSLKDTVWLHTTAVGFVVGVTALTFVRLGVSVLYNYLSGLTTSNNASTPTTKIDVAAGQCADSSNAVLISISAGTIDCGTVGANGLDAGALANNTWYHTFVIARADGTSALLASTSPTAPALPSGYTAKRRIGSFKTDGSAHCLSFFQKGDVFSWPLAILDVNGATVPLVESNVTLSIPPGVQTFPIIAIQGVAASGTDGINVSNGGTTTGGAAFGTVIARVSTSYSTFVVTTLLSDTSQHVVWRANNSGTVSSINTGGWTDRRGRDG